MSALYPAHVIPWRHQQCRAATSAFGRAEASSKLYCSFMKPKVA